MNMNLIEPDIFLPPPDMNLLQPNIFQGLQRQVSAVSRALDNYSNANNIITQSRLDIVKESLIIALRAIKEIAPRSEITFFLYNLNTTIIEGTIDELLELIPRWQPCSITDFSVMLDAVKEKIANLDDFYTILLTDGHHNGQVKLNILLEDQSIYGLFSNCLGIGNDANVETRLLRILCGDKPTKCLINSDKNIISDYLIESCFNGLIKLTNGKLHIIIRNSADSNIPECNIRYLLEEDLNKIDFSIHNNNLQCIKNNNNITIEYKKSENNNLSELQSIYGDVQKKFIICVDNSGSMAEELDNNINRLSSKRKLNVEKDKHLEFPYIEYIFDDTITRETYIMLSGDIVAAYINENDIIQTISIIDSEELDAKSTEDQIINSFLELMNQLNEIDKIPVDRINFPEIQIKLKKLYMDNLTFISDIDELNIDNRLIIQCKTLWQEIVRRYKSSLTAGQYHVQEMLSTITLGRAVSSQTARQYSTGINYIEKSNICKICYEKPIDIIFDPCYHLICCQECTETTIDTTGITKYNCPFCRQNVENIIKIDTSEPKCQIENCSKCVKYYGDCRHPISCSQCIESIRDLESGLIRCHICDKDVTVFKVNLA
jgi:hypothetical protein